MSLTAAQLLDELMGRDRNLVPGEKSTQVHWSNEDVCKSFLCGFCPNDLFVNTKADLGICNKIHDEALKQDYEKSSRYGRMGFEDEFLLSLKEIQSDVERKIRRGHERLFTNSKREQELAEKDSDKTKMLTDHINQLLAEIEQLGSEGKVEEAQGVSHLLDQLKEEREHSKTNSGIPGQEKQMEVCEICGAFLIVGDVQSRVDDHLQGKQHVGYAKIKSTIENLRERPWLKRKQNYGEWERGSDKNNPHKERDGDRTRSKERERERNREHSRRSRSRERRKHNRSKSRERYRERREKSRDRNESGHSRDCDRDHRDREKDLYNGLHTSRNWSYDRIQRNRSYSEERWGSRRSSIDLDQMIEKGSLLCHELLDRPGPSEVKDEPILNTDYDGECSSTGTTQDYSPVDVECALGDEPLMNHCLRENVANLPTQDYVSNPRTQNYDSNVFCTSNQSTPKYTSILQSEDFTTDSLETVGLSDTNEIGLELKQSVLCYYQADQHFSGLRSKEGFESRSPYPQENDDYI